MSGAVADIDFFFFGFVSREESVAFFLGEGSQTGPQCAAMHSSFDTERKFAAFPKLVVLTFFFYLFSVQKIPVLTFRQL